MRVSLPARHPGTSDLPIEDAAPGRLMAWLTGGIVAVAVTVCGIALLAAHHVARLTATPVLATVALPPAATAPADDPALVDLLATLHAREGVAAANIVPAAELDGLAPAALWAGTPRLVDLTFSPGAAPDLEALETELRAIVPAATIEAAATPAVAAVSEARLLGRTAVVMLGGLAAVLVLVVAALTRGSVEAQAGTVELLRLMGAPETRLGREIERQLLACSVRGGLRGFALGTLTLAGLLAAAYLLPGVDLPGGRLGLVDWIALMAVPITAALVTVTVTRLTARQALRAIP